MAPKFVVQTKIETGRRLAQASPQLLHCEHCSEDDEDDYYGQIVDEVADHEDNGVHGDDQDDHGDDKNSHILPTGQWYAPSADIKHA